MGVEKIMLPERCRAEGCQFEATWPTRFCPEHLKGVLPMQTIKRTAVIYMQPESKDWPEADWDEAARWERLALEDRGAVVNDQRKIQWGAEPRIETDYTTEVSVGYQGSITDLVKEVTEKVSE